MIKTYTRPAKFSQLKHWCPMAKPDDFIEVCEWANGEGFDVTMGDKMFQLSWGEFQAIQALVAYRE